MNCLFQVMASSSTKDFRNPELPFVSTIANGLFPGQTIVISGTVLQSTNNARRFFIDLCCGLLIQGDHMDNKALHFNPRFDSNGGWFSGAPDRQLVINSFINNSWGIEERFLNPFEERKPFQIRILVLKNYFKIAVNGKHLCDYEHRIPINQVKTIFVDGNIRLDFVEFHPKVRQGKGGRLFIDKSVKKTEELTKIDKPVLPFVWKVPAGGFVPPQSTQFTLTPFMSANRFNIDFLADNEHFFHFRVDFPNNKDKSSKVIFWFSIYYLVFSLCIWYSIVRLNYFHAAVVRNSTKGIRWQIEERQIGQFPFSKGITCDIHMIAYGRSIAVDVNGFPFIKFNYREGDNPVKINEIKVTGDCILQRFVHRA